MQNEGDKERVSSSQRGAHQQNGAQSTSFFSPCVERTNIPPCQSAVSFRSELHSANYNLPLFLDSLICPARSLFSSYPACTPADCRTPVLFSRRPSSSALRHVHVSSLFQNIRFEEDAILSIKLPNEQILRLQLVAGVYLRLIAREKKCRVEWISLRWRRGTSP